MAGLLRLALVLLALAAIGAQGAQPVIAVQSGMQDYGVRRQSWTSPTTVRPRASWPILSLTCRPLKGHRLYR